MSVLSDTVFVSRTSILDVETGDTFSYTLGIDTSIRVFHELTESSVETSLTVIEQPYTVVDPTVTTT